MSENNDVAGFVAAGARRRRVLKSIARQPATPSDLAAELSTDITNISKTLTELRERNLVELLVEESRRKGRLYGATDKGQEVVEYIRDS